MAKSASKPRVSLTIDQRIAKLNMKVEKLNTLKQISELRKKLKTGK